MLSQASTPGGGGDGGGETEGGGGNGLGGGGGGDADGDGGGGRAAGGLVAPQSAQSVPASHSPYSAPGPPSGPALGPNT